MSEDKSTNPPAAVPTPLPVVAENPERCETCRWSEPVIDDPDSPLRCRRYPPILLDDRSEGANSDSLGVGWPWTQAADWCGEWAAKQDVVPVDAAAVLMMPFQTLELSLRTCRAIKGHKVPKSVTTMADVVEHIETVGDLCRFSAEYLATIHNIGPLSIPDIRTALARHGLKLREES